MWSCSDPGGHWARVSAIGPNSIWFRPADFQVPRPRLQSRRTLTLPSAAKATVYIALSCGARRVSSPPRNLTSCHEVPARLSAAGCAGICAQPASNSTSASRPVMRLTLGLLYPREQCLAQGLALAELRFELRARLAVVVGDRDARNLEELVTVVAQGADVHGAVAGLRRHLEAAGEVGLLLAAAANVEKQQAAQDVRGDRLAAHEERAADQR